MVADHYEKLGFTRLISAIESDTSVFSLSLAGYTLRNSHIKVTELIHG